VFVYVTPCCDAQGGRQNESSQFAFDMNANIFRVCSAWYKCKAIPLQAWTGPEGTRRLRLLEFQECPHMKVVRLSAQRTGHLYAPGNTAGTHFFYRLTRPQGHSAAGRIISMKNSNDTIGNRTRDFPACSAVPQPAAPPLPHILGTVSN
jgi:hypothetical protein